MLAATALTPRPAAALDPQRSVTQYTHRTWPVGLNGLGSAALSISQAPDGYLLFGAQDGIYRFDGERFRRWQPWTGASRSVRFVNDMLFARGGALYLSLRDGLARYSNARIFFFRERLVEPSILEDPQGSLWIGSLGLAGIHNEICRVGGNHLICRGSADGALCKMGLRAAPAPGGGVLSFGNDGVCRLPDKGRERLLPYPHHRSVRYTRLASDPAGHVTALLRSSSEQLLLQTDGLRWKSVATSAKLGDGRTLFRDRRGALWIGTWRSGLWRIVDGRAEHYTRADGLSGNNVAAIFEDRDGSIWVATTEGVDQFRASPVIRFGAAEGLSGDRPANLFVTRSGELWVANVYGVDAFRDGRLLTPAPRAASRRDILSLVQDSEGRTWSIIGGVGVFYENQRRPLRNDLHVPLTDPQDLVATLDGNVWTGNVTADQITPRGALVQMRAGGVVAAFPTPASVDHAVINKLAPDGKDGLWVAVADHGAMLFRNGHFTPLPLPGNTNVLGIAPTGPGSAWMATMDGLYHVTARGIVRRLGGADGLPCEAFPALTTTRAGDLWLKSDCGLLHIPKAELERVLKKPGAKVHPDQIDAADGAPIDEYSNRPYETPDGKVWFSNFTGLFMVDGKAATAPSQPIPAFIDDIKADGKAFLAASGRRSPAQPRRIEIYFSAIDFDRPDRLAFHYQLSRGGRLWRAVTTERTAAFTDLGPGHYHFTVVACENGVRCSARPASLSFEIPPTFLQTSMFKVALAFGVSLLAWASYRLWLRQLTKDIQRRTEARLGERERIARDLHDTLLQGFQGLLLRIQGVANKLPSDHPLRSGLEGALNRGEDIIVEGRDRVRELRADENGLPDILRKFIDDACLDCDAEIVLDIKGAPRDLRRGIGTEVGQVAREALCNACRHADASQITLSVEFGPRRLDIQIADDGKGMTLRTGSADAAPHFGLSGMRERASRLKASLIIDSAPGRGTQVSLSLPSKLAYVPESGRARDVFVNASDWLARRVRRIFPGLRGIAPPS